MPLNASKEFPGLGFDYDPATHPFFKALAKENLRKLALLPTGRLLLNAIAEAQPGHRSSVFPANVNVALQPPLSNVFVPPGTRADGTITDVGKYNEWVNGTKGRMLIATMAAKAQADPSSYAPAHEADTLGTPSIGSTVRLYYSNTEILADNGTWFIPHVTMGHELIHCYHSLIGQMKLDGKQEEYYTGGIKGWEKSRFTENKLRAEAGFPLRTKYFSDD